MKLVIGTDPKCQNNGVIFSRLLYLRLLNNGVEKCLNEQSLVVDLSEDYSPQ